MNQKKLRLLGVFSLLVLLISISLSASSCSFGSSLDIDYVSDRLSEYNLPNFDKTKFRAAEKIFHKYAADALPDAQTLTENTVALYFESYHDYIDTADKDEVTDALLSCYAYATGDRYAVYRNPTQYEDYSSNMSGNFYGIGVVITHDKELNTVTVKEVYEDSGAEAAGILPGDLIIGTDGNRLSDVGYDKVVEALKDDSKLTVDVLILRSDTEITLTVTKKEIVEQSVKYSIDENKIGYIKISSFKSNTTNQFKEAVDFMENNGAVGIIYDLRSNPGGYLSAVVNMLSYISPKGTTIASFSNDYANTKIDRDSHSISLPSVVICNENTASAGELFTAAMRDFDEEFGYFEVTVVGVTTHGKGVMQSTFSLSDGSYVTLTVAYYNPPSGVNYDGVGIIPDIVIEDDSARLGTAYDEILKLVK
ncbi:MAG: hypothetical protein E7612_09980 [Ruminococcaceae bacterium]|nr:hypothetical protein [Oscillospiraceae bacterium]